MDTIKRRDGGVLLVLSVLTCGLYLFYWYHEIYRELEELSGETPTGNSYWIDLLLHFVTCSLFGIFVDYKISQQIHALIAEVRDTLQVTGLVVTHSRACATQCGDRIGIIADGKIAIEGTVEEMQDSDNELATAFLCVGSD